MFGLQGHDTENTLVETEKDGAAVSLWNDIREMSATNHDLKVY